MTIDCPQNTVSQLGTVIKKFHFFLFSFFFFFFIFFFFFLGGGGGGYIVGYTVVNSNENLVYGYPHLMRFYSLVSECRSVISRIKPRKGPGHPTKCDVINGVKLFPTVHHTIAIFWRYPIRSRACQIHYDVQLPMRNYCNKLRNRSRIREEYAECSTNWARINRNPQQFTRFFLTIVIKMAHSCFGDINSKMNIPCIAAAELILQLECRKQLVI